MIRRNSFVISRALRNFLGASVMTSLAGQLAVTTDAVIVSNMIGPDALSATNMVMPLTMLFSCASILIGLGASILAAKAIGDRNKEQIDRIFTTALIMLTIAGLAVSVITYTFCPELVNTICDNARITPLAFEYTQVITAGAVFLIISNGINYFVSTDGCPRLVTKGVIAGAIANVILDIILVKLMGIAGSAWATIINYIITLLIVSTHFFNKNSSYHIINPLKGITDCILCNLYEGLPLMLGNLLLGGAVFIINSMILSAAGADGVYIWAICLQVLMLTFVILNGVGNAMLSIGGVLIGEKDYRGIHILTTLSIKLVVLLLAIFEIFVLLFPETPAYIFGAENAPAGIDPTSPLRIFSLLLIPFAVTLVMRFLFQILEHRILSLVLSAGQLAGIVGTLWIFTKWTPEELWWSFPVSAITLIIIQLATTFIIHFNKKNVSPLTLIPTKTEGELSADFSVEYNNSATGYALDCIDEFLRQSDIAARKIEECKECIQGVMHKLRQEGETGKRYFDIHIRVIGNNIQAIMRNAGKRLDTGHFLKSLPAIIEHKYMYGQNVLFMMIK